MNKVHRLLRKWEVGEQCRLSVKKKDFNSPAHAVNYICKYLIKPPQKGFSEWMLKTPRLRFMGSSRSIGKLVSDDENNHDKTKEKEEKRVYQVKLPYERIAECDNNLVFMQYDSKLDKDVYIGSCNACKEAVKLSPSHIEFNDFDMETGNMFKVIGFKNRFSYYYFLEKWLESFNQYKVNEWLRLKRMSILENVYR